MNTIDRSAKAAKHEAKMSVGEIVRVRVHQGIGSWEILAEIIEITDYSITVITIEDAGGHQGPPDILQGSRFAIPRTICLNWHPDLCCVLLRRKTTWE